jgi:hypothetical protein
MEKELTTLKGHKKRHVSALFISGYGELNQRPRAKSMASFLHQPNNNQHSSDLAKIYGSKLAVPHISSTSSSETPKL